MGTWNNIEYNTFTDFREILINSNEETSTEYYSETIRYIDDLLNDNLIYAYYKSDNGLRLIKYSENKLPHSLIYRLYNGTVGEKVGVFQPYNNADDLMFFDEELKPNDLRLKNFDKVTIPQEILKQYENIDMTKANAAGIKKIKCYLLHIQGLTREQIAKKVGYSTTSPSNISNYIAQGKDKAAEIGLPNIEKYKKHTGGM